MTKEEFVKEAEEINITYENNVFHCTKNGTKWISIDGEKWYGEEKRITELKTTNKRISDECHKLVDSLEKKQKEVVDLEKENAELKSENQKWKDEWQEKVQEATDEGYARTLQTMQLTKAKDIIREVVEWATWQGSNCPNFKSIQDKAEQFLSEVEK